MNSLLLKHIFLLFGANSFSAIASMEFEQHLLKNMHLFYILKVLLKKFNFFYFFIYFKLIFFWCFQIILMCIYQK